MAAANGYITLSDFKNLITAPGHPLDADTTDDAVISNLIEAASRYIDHETRRRFYPTVETHYLSVPDADDTNDARLMMLDDDLLAATTLTNGDATVLTTTDYYLLPRNIYPKWGIRLKDTSSEYWDVDSNSEADYVITLAGIWGYHDNYGVSAWAAGSTLNEATGITASETTFTVTSGTLFAVGQTIRIDSEYMLITGVSTNDLTVIRAHNGTTGATHSNAAVVYYYTPMADVRQACFEIALNSYRRRYGESNAGGSTVTAGGMVVGPKDVGEFARRVIASLHRSL